MAVRPSGVKGAVEMPNPSNLAANTPEGIRASALVLWVVSPCRGWESTGTRAAVFDHLFHARVLPFWIIFYKPLTER